MKVVKFKHRRTAGDVEWFAQIWPDSNRAAVAAETFDGEVHSCGSVTGNITVVHLFGGERVHVLIGVGDQSGAETAMLVTLDVDDARVVTKSVGGHDPMRRLLELLPREVGAAMAEAHSS